MNKEGKYNYRIKGLRLLSMMAFLFISVVLYGQGEGANWYFGNNAGISFNAGSVNSVSNGALKTNEGCATISNSKGELLFYTDGITVWDKNHDIMPNGNGLLGDASSTQSAVIVPKPNSETIYYIFTVVNESRVEGLRYSEVDITLNNGNGNVTSNKNVPLMTPCAEKISAVKHANGKDYWVASHGWDNSSFATFKVTENGVEITPVISSIGSHHDGHPFVGIGYMKFSPNGRKLALARWSTNSLVEIFDFDSNTGAISNPITLDNIFDADNENGAYGIEFSPNSKLLYVSEIDLVTYTSRLNQFDLSIYTKTDIIDSRVILYQGKNLISAIQLASDGKIYLCRTFASYLDAIETPNAIGVSSNYITRAVDLNGRRNVYGLPTFIQSIFVAEIEASDFCLNDSTQFKIKTDESINSIIWNFGDSESSGLNEPNHVYKAPGAYKVEAKINTGYSIINISKDIVIYEAPIANEVKDFILCDDVANDGFESFDLNIKTPEVLGGQLISDFEVSYFASALDAAKNKDPLPTTYINKINKQRIYAKKQNRLNSDCYDISSFLLVVETKTAGVVEDLLVCDDKSNDGKEIIDLRQFNEQVSANYLVTPQDNCKITYHLTQDQANLGTLALPYNLEVIGSQDIYARIENTNCFDTTNFKIVINDMITAYQPDNMYVCDDTSNDSNPVFDLQTQTPQVLNTQTGKVTYHLTQNDADLGINAIVDINNYENQTNPQKLFVRAESLANASCYETTSFYVKVNNQPIIDMDDVWYFCTGEDVLVYVNSIHDKYIWNTGEVGPEIVVDKPGQYTVTVYNIDKEIDNTVCELSKTINVIELDYPKSVSIETSDWTANNNSILVNVDGAGNYNYSIDGYDYQESNFFDNLLSGDYIVYVKNENECIVYSEEVYLLNYPRFFTPNNDGYNDVWKISFSETEPDIQISIFDRYGKLLTQLNPLSNGWDGTFNGQLLASSDYWFVVDRPSVNKQYTGHFTLKR